MDELKQIATRYLLGELTEQEQAALEQRYFSDRHVFHQVLQVESQLADAYARGQMSAQMRARFEDAYLKHPARRRRVNFARALTTRIDERQASISRSEQSSQSLLQISWAQRLFAKLGGREPSLRFAMALTVVLIAVAGFWIFVARTWRQERREAPPLQSQLENQNGRVPQQTTAQQPSETSPQSENQNSEERAARIAPPNLTPSPKPSPNSAPSTVSLALTVGGVRSTDGGPTPTLIIPRDSIRAQIFLSLKDDSYPRYRVSLRKIGGTEIFSQTNIRPRTTRAGARFVFTLPARQLTSGDYALTLGGITPQGEVDNIDKSLFRVEKH